MSQQLEKAGEETRMDTLKVTRDDVATASEHEAIRAPERVREFHFHSDQCYGMGPGDTEVLICGDKVAVEAKPELDYEQCKQILAADMTAPPGPLPKPRHALEPVALCLYGAVQELRALRASHHALLVALEELVINANRLCDRQLGGTYEDDCRRSIKQARAAIAQTEGR